MDSAVNEANGLMSGTIRRTVSAYLGKSLIVALLAIAGPAFAANCTTGACACGDTVAAGAKVTFDGTEDIVTGAPCGTNPALTVSAGATLDMNAQGITCDGTFGGIVLSETGSKLKNGSVDGCTIGVSVGGGGKHKVDDIVSTGSQFGFAVTSEKNKLSYNTASGNSMRGFILPSSAPKNQLRGNVARNNTGHGFELTGQVKLKENIANNNTGNGFFATSGEKHSFTKNVASNNGVAGFRVLGNAHKFKGNAALANSGDGFLLQGGSKYTLAKNTAIDNGGDGFEVVAGSAFTLSKNASARNGANGFSLSGSDHKLSGNRAMANGSRGIIVFSGSGSTTVKKSVAMGNAPPDLRDLNAACGTNTWSGNIFETSDPARGSSPQCIE